MGRRVRASRRSKDVDHAEDHEEDEEEEHQEDDAHEGSEGDDDENDEDEDDELGRGQKRKALGLGDWDGGEWEVEAIVKGAAAKQQKILRETVPDTVPDKIKDLEDADSRKLISEVMRFILFRNLARKQCRTSHIIEHVIKPSNIDVTANQRKILLAIIQHRFADVFGYHLVSTSDAPAEKIQDENWMLLSLNESPDLRKDKGKENEANPVRGMAMVILSLIMLNDGAISEKKLTQELGKLGVPATSEKTGKNKLVFPDVAKATKQVRELGFISRRKSDRVNDDNSTIFEYVFGPNAKLEIGLPNIIRFMETMTNTKLKQKDVDRFLKPET
ncbi:Non-structural maintenance of chromosomes element 3-like [Hondaea fermentalgiana]|uniref:Non-structural maintenance of chromosomes element 3-like n=1 Tax=Hondaea fermentalgiana TaxID=2315210 RepID=A0A2R5G9R4_9STRA|nr:Non-structural maintenance of chromosomes element 3-like [Hondaea fermentalgiana]|eukprot:GBG27777.1 Non-structural maintenance of chromosomes element 3-like [Hondaea fermentalgiana]